MPRGIEPWQESPQSGQEIVVLSDRLTQLTGAGVVERRRTPGWPARVCYTLTERGHALVPVLRVLWDWGSRPR
ncbi:MULTISPECIES: winged helix-turn-helix transcriptional regulator [unclassified Nocardia]|uniref:winged helix-turn-helix transcriptional regulator n=1 Tax=unclassified Nocardia TaxID=2637762 RepID=UPI00278C01A5|nr:winged helix-turn-helix transcriptional regulator [Nocardia sp. CC213A]